MVLGLSAAYVLAGFAEYKSPVRTIPRMDITAMSPENERIPWEGLIFEKNILNLEIPVDVPEPVKSDTTPELENWRLLGTVIGERDMALVSVDGQTELVAGGQTLNGWELSEILPQSTKWKSSARTRTLTLWAEDRNHDQQRPPSRTSFAQDQQGSQRVTLSSQDIQPFLSDPNSLLQMAQFKPYTRQGEMSGFQLTNIRGDSILRKLGLRNGDVLTRIDGRPITGPTELLQAYSSLSSSTLVSMDILRRGENVSFLVEIE